MCMLCHGCCFPGKRSIALTDSAPDHITNMIKSPNAMLSANKLSTRLTPNSGVGRALKWNVKQCLIYRVTNKQNDR